MPILPSMLAKFKLGLSAFVILILIFQSSASFSTTLLAGGYNCDEDQSYSNDIEDPLVLSKNYIAQNPLMPESEKQIIVKQAQEIKEGLARAKRECEIGKIQKIEKTKRVEEFKTQQKLKKKEIAQILVDSLKTGKEPNITISDVYDLGDSAAELGLSLSSPQTEAEKMYVIIDKKAILNIDLIKIDAEVNEAYQQLQTKSSEISNSNIKNLETSNSPSKLVENNFWNSTVNGFFGFLGNMTNQIKNFVFR